MEISNRHDRYKLDDYISMSSYVAIDPRVSALYTDTISLVGIKGHVEELIKWLIDGNKKTEGGIYSRNWGYRQDYTR